MAWHPILLGWHPLQYARFIYAQRVNGFTIPTEPVLDDVAKAYFVECLENCSAYLEFGAGGSTLLADKLGKRTLTVESDRFFARSIRRALRKDTSVEILEIDTGMTGEWSRPVFTRPTDRRLRRWSAYSTRPFDVIARQGWFPDFVLVDGRFRRACVLQTVRNALERNRAVQILVDDYFLPDREHYRSVEEWLGVPERAGRAAVFSVSRESCKPPSAADVAQAVRDYR